MFCVITADELLPDGDVADVKVFHVVRALHVVMDHTFPCAAKRLDGVNLSLLQGEQHTVNNTRDHKTPEPQTRILALL